METLVRCDEDFNEPQRSCNLDYNDDNLSFSQGIKDVPVLSHIVLPKISKYDGKGVPAKHLNNYKIHISLRGSTPVRKYKAFHLTLSVAIEV